MSEYMKISGQIRHSDDTKAGSIKDLIGQALKLTEGRNYRLPKTAFCYCNLQTLPATSAAYL